MSTTAGATVASPPGVNTTFGVLFIGFIFGVTLYGLTFFQTYVFYSRFPNDSLWTKCMVGLLWAIDTTTTALLSHMQYFYLITSFLSPWDKLPVTRTFMAEKGLAALAIFIVQSYYTTRVYSITERNAYISGIIGFLALATFALGVVGSVQLSDRELISALVTPRMKVVIGLSEGIATLCDILIVAALCYYLRAARRPEMRTPSDWFERGIRLVINRGTSFTMWQSVLFITFVAMPHSQVWILFHFIVSKACINSLFSMLNSRKAPQGRGIHEEDDIISKEQGKGSHVPRSGQGEPLEFCRHHGQATAFELGPVASTNEVPRLSVDVNARAKSSIDSETLRGPVSPSSTKALSFGPA